MKTQLRKKLFPKLSSQSREQLFLILGGLLIQCISIGFGVALLKTSTSFVPITCFLIYIGTFTISFLLILMYSWIFSDGEDEKITWNMIFKFSLLAVAATLFMDLLTKVLFSPQLGN